MPAPAASVAPVETADLIRRLASPCGPEAVEEAARRLATKLGDVHSLGYHRMVCERVRDRRLPFKTVISGFKQAMSGTASVPGAVFNAFLKEHGPPGWAHKATPGATRQSPPGVAHSRQSVPIPMDKFTRRVNP